MPANKLSLDGFRVGLGKAAQGFKEVEEWLFAGHNGYEGGRMNK